MRRSAVSILLIVLIAFGMVACEVVESPSGITCEKLRQLKVGMTFDEVRDILGTPPWEGDNHGQDREHDREWSYTVGAVRLIADFFHGKLVSVSSYIRTTWREWTGRYDGGRPTLFWLYKDNYREGKEFTSIFCPGSS